MERRTTWLRLIGAFVVGFVGLTLEIAYTRIISFKLFYYYTYFVIGLALLGLSGLDPGPLRKLTVVPSYLLMTYAAFAMATIKFVRGQTMATWQPRAG